MASHHASQSPLGSRRFGAALARTTALVAPAVLMAGLLAPLAHAADTTEVQAVVITGSRIATTNLTSASPISVASHEDIVLSAATTVEDVLTKITAVDFNGGISAATNNGGAGESVIGLRNLGPQRTLVLIDGQRLIPGTGGSVDFNSIPLSIVDHVEVLKDGASSIYGADAIGGVINVVTKRHTEGVNLNANYGVSSEGDGQTYGIDGSMGVASDKGDILIGMSWDHREPVHQSNRDWGLALHADDPNYAGGTNWRTQLDVLQNENNTSQIWVNGVLRSAKDPTVASVVPHVAFISGKGKIKLSAGDWNYLTSGLDRKQLNLMGHYAVTNDVNLVFEGFYTDYKANQALRPEPLLGDTIATTAYAGLIIPKSNPYNTTGGDITAYLTPTQFGPRLYDEETQTYRLRVGLEGTFRKDYKWEIGYVTQNNTQTQITRNEGNFYHLGQLTGQIACVDVPGGCTNGQPTVPVNWFNGPNLFTPAQVKYLTFNNTSLNKAYERYGYGDVSGPIWDLPAGQIKAAVGFEFREEHYENSPDQLVQAGYGPNQQQPTGGGYQVSSIYGELNIPLLKDLPFVKAMTLSPSVRYDDYSTFGGQQTYKVGLNYEITDELRFRSAFATAIRAPQVSELFGGTTISDNGGSGDPCDTRAPGFNGNPNIGKGVLTAGSTCSKAVAGGAAVTHFEDVLDAIPSNQIQTLTGGNINLKPEEAHTFTAGFIVTPKFVPGLRIALDYYNIVIKNTILTGGLAGVLGNDAILIGCYGPSQNQNYCNYVHRDANGNIIQIDSLNDNFGTAKAEGVDLEIAYNTRDAHLNLPVPGWFNLDLVVNNQIKNNQSNPDGTITNLNGFFSTNNETTQPRWKGTLNVDYVLNAFKARYSLRYQQHVWDLNGGVKSGFYGDAVPDIAYSDISFSYDFRHHPVIGDLRVIFGVDNLFDKDPPFIGTDSICKCNTLAGPYDVIGRYFFTRLSTKF